MFETRITQAVVILLYIFACGYIAVKANRGTKDLESYIRPKLGPWTVALTGFATAFSTSLVVVGGSFGYSYGATVQWIAIPQAVGLALMYLIFASPLNTMSDKLGALTLNEFLGKRYQSQAIQTVSAVVLFVFCIGNLLVVYRGLGLVIEQVLGVPLIVAVIVSGVLTAWYTGYGGMLAVAKTDAMQGMIMTVGMIALIIVGLTKAGGISNVHQELALISPALVETPGNYPLGIFLGLIATFSFGMLGQPQLLVRCMFIKNKKDIPLIAMITFVISALAAWVAYYSGCITRVLNPNLADPSQALPVLISTLFNPIVATIIMLAMAAAAMSTASSVLIMASTTASRDVYQRFINKKASDEQVKKISYWLTVGLGLAGMIGALKPPSWFIFIMAFVWAVWASTYMFPILYGLYWKGVTEYGALAGMIVGPAVAVIWKLAGQPFNLHPIFPGVLTSIILVPIVSLITPKLSSELINNLFPEKNKITRDESISA